MAFDRNTSITSAVEKGIPLDRIEAGLAKDNMKPLNAYERRLIETGRWGTNYLERVGMDAKDIFQGISTITALAGEKLTDPNIYLNWEQANKDLVRGLTGQAPLKDKYTREEQNKMIANFIGSPYGVSTKNNLRTNLENAAVSFAVNPLNILDILPVAGVAGKSKTVAKAADKATEAVAKVTNPIPVVSDIRKSVAPTAREKEISTILNLQEAPTAKKITQLEKQLNELQKEGDFTQAVENLTTGVWKEGTEDFTRKVRDIIDQQTYELRELGLDRDIPRLEAISFSILNEFDPDRTKGLLVTDIKQAINKNNDLVEIDLELKDKDISLDRKNKLEDKKAKLKSELEEFLEPFNKSYEKFDKYYMDKVKDYHRGLIGVTSQRGLNSGKKGTGLVKQEGILTQRDVGNATIEEIGKRFPLAVQQLQKEINKVNNTIDSIDEIVTSGKKISPEDVDNIGKNEVVVSPKEFTDMVADSYSRGELGKLPDIVDTFSKGARKSSIKKYADDLYVLPKNELEAVKNASRRVSSNLPIINALKPISSMMKTAVLSTPQYFAGNRLGNFILNTMGGGDYLEAGKRLLTKELGKDIPDYLLQTTSYQGLAPSAFTETFDKTWVDNLQRVRDITKEEGLLRGIEEFNKISTSPLFKAESTVEVFDRMAAYYGAAKRYANATGKKLNQVLSEAKKDPKLERRLLQEVNNTLGDYVGRNRFINPETQAILNTVVPFNKVITTSAEILPRLAKDRPLSYQTMFRYPAVFGKNYYESQEGIPENPEARGGVMISPAPYQGGPVRVRYNEYNPLIAPLEYLSLLAPSKESLVDRISRQGFTGLGYITGFANALQGEDIWGNPVLGPNTFKTGDKIITLDNNGNRMDASTARIEEGGDIPRALLGYGARTFVPLVNIANRAVLPLASTFANQPYYQPTSGSVFGQIGDLQIPYLMEGKKTRGQKGFRDFALDVGGFRTREVYPEFKQQIRKQDIKNILRNQIKQERLRQLREGDR